MTRYYMINRYMRIFTLVSHSLNYTTKILKYIVDNKSIRWIDYKILKEIYNTFYISLRYIVYLVSLSIVLILYIIFCDFKLFKTISFISLFLK